MFDTNGSTHRNRSLDSVPPGIMAIPRPSKTKSGVSLRTLAQMAKKPVGTLKSMSARDPEGFKIRVDRLLKGGKFDDGAPGASTDLLSQAELADEIERMKSDFWRLHMSIVAARDDLRDREPEVYARFQPIPAISAKWLDV
jgi:hypothetical protein